MFTLSNIADIFGILSFIMSIVLFIITNSIFKNVQSQKNEYIKEQFSLKTNLQALRQNIWDDSLDSIEIRSKLRTELFTYRQNYWKILSPICHYRIHKSLRYIKTDIKPKNREALCVNIDYLVGRFSRKEFTKHD